MRPVSQTGLPVLRLQGQDLWGEGSGRGSGRAVLWKGVEAGMGDSGKGALLPVEATAAAP